LPVSSAAVVHVLDLDPIKHLPRGKAQGSHRGAFDHRSRVSNELPRRKGPATRLVVHGAAFNEIWGLSPG
jgi:hypothetical protein